jgi:hypothetical protein
VAVNIFGASTPAVADSGDAQSIVLGVKIFTDVPGQVLGCSFYKAATNVGIHVVSLWDSAGKLLATQPAASEAASGKQLVLFSSPVSIGANQVFTCGYFAPNGHFSNDKNTFTVQKNVPPLHVPANGGVFGYGGQATQWPTSTWTASNYWVDVLFVAAIGSTWISAITATTTATAATVTRNTAIPSDSQVEYGPTTSYGNITALANALVTAHSVVISGLLPGSISHFRVRCHDSDAVLVVSADHTLVTAFPVSVSTSPSSATMVSNATQQFTAIVSNTPDLDVAWSATAGIINSSGLFTAPTVSAPILVKVTATSQADASKSASAIVTVNMGLALTANPTRSPPIQHSVALSWKGSTNLHVVSYNMYRSTVSGTSYGLGASAIGTSTFLDQAVQSGMTYYYVVTAVDDRGVESGYSNEIRAVIPQ